MKAPHSPEPSGARASRCRKALVLNEFVSGRKNSQGSRQSKGDLKVEGNVMTKDPVNKSEFYQPLSVVTGPPQRFLTSERFLGIGQDVGADEFKLVIRIPGDNDNQLL